MSPFGDQRCAVLAALVLKTADNLKDRFDRRLQGMVFLQARPDMPKSGIN